MGRDESKHLPARPDPVARLAEVDRKAARLAQALRDNLKRRKDQARGRGVAASASGPKPAAES